MFKIAGEKIAKYLMNGFNKTISSNFLFGIVTSIDPIKIKIEGLPELESSQIILSDNVKEKKIKIPTEGKPNHKHKINTLITTASGEDNHTHEIPPFETMDALPEITLWGNLKINDKVFIIQSNDKQLFYVMEVIKDDTKK